MYKKIIQNKITKKYLLSEIVFKIASNTELNIKYTEIKNSIEENGFENTVLIYSIADSTKVGGNIGWINESSLNRKIRENIESLNVGDLSEPILIPNGALILKINDIKQENKKIDIELELKKTIEYKRNILLNQYSQIYFNKIRKNLLFNE